MKYSSLQKIGNIAFLLLFVFNILVGGVHHILHSEEFLHTEHQHYNDDAHQSNKHFCENEANVDCDLDLFIHHQDFIGIDEIHLSEAKSHIFSLKTFEFLISHFQIDAQTSFLRGPPTLS